MFWGTRCGVPWRDVPPSFGHWKTIANRHRRWSGDGTLAGVLDVLRCDADVAEGPDWTIGVDGAVVRAHQHAAGAPAASRPPTSPPTSPRRSSRRPSWTQGGGSNDKKSASEPDPAGATSTRPMGKPS